MIDLIDEMECEIYENNFQNAMKCVNKIREK